MREIAAARHAPGCRPGPSPWVDDPHIDRDRPLWHQGGSALSKAASIAKHSASIVRTAHSVEATRRAARPCLAGYAAHCAECKALRGVYRVLQ